MSTIIQQNTILVPVPSASCKHLFIVLTTPDGEPPLVVMVNITTRRPTSDSTVILTPGDHPFIRHESVIAFEHADLFDVGKLEKGLSNGSLSKYPDINESLFDAVKQGLFDSPRTPQNIKTYCRSSF